MLFYHAIQIFRSRQCVVHQQDIKLRDLSFSSPGHLSKDKEHLKFREKLMEMGVHIFLGLPHGTKGTQEMDQGFTEFKPACNASTVHVAAKKMAAHVAARKKMKAKQQ